MDNIKEIIGRSTMALVAIALAGGASLIVHSTVRLGADFDKFVWLGLWLLALTLYVLALALGCFVFATRDPRKANGAHVAGIWLFEGFGGLLKLLFSWDWWI
ncbi:MAG TPA: hypothetical protein VFW23_06195 [Tepidisphaeraceae bacterium]|nr:hypothetical protein [Tepidisphaeraceae bacterium]